MGVLIVSLFLVFGGRGWVWFEGGWEKEGEGVFRWDVDVDWADWDVR